MNQKTFATFLKDLRIYFNKEALPPEQIEAWFEIIKDIPEGEHVNWICKEIKKQESFFPINLPKVMLDYYNRWKDEHPNAPLHSQQENNRQKNCPDKCTDGLWFAEVVVYDKVRGVNIKQRTVFACKKCNRSEYPYLPKTTLEDLKKQGIKVFNDPNQKREVVLPDGSKVKSNLNFKGLLNKIKGEHN